MILGLIGGVGSGKSAVTTILEQQYGYRILRTDDMAKELELPGRPVYLELKKLYGDAILNLEADVESEDLRPIDKPKFANLLYSDPEIMKAVNNIVHPATWAYVDREIVAEKEKAGEPGKEANVAVETALPNEHFREICEEIWFIYADPQIRIGRLMESRGYTREKCESIIAGQRSEEEFLMIADYTVNNSGSLEETAERIRELCK